MRRTYLILLAAIYSISFLSCEKETVEMPPAPEPLYVTAQAYGEELEGIEYLHFTTGALSPQSARLQAPATWNDSIIETEMGPALFTGAIGPEAYGDPLFGLEFWPEEPGRAFSKTEMEDFFRPGRQFEYGRGPGKVDIMACLPRKDGTLMETASRASFMAPHFAIAGHLYIREAEEYVYEHPSGRRLQGMRITCNFSGILGHYDVKAVMDSGEEAIAWDGLKVIMKGETAFFVAYP